MTAQGPGKSCHFHSTPTDIKQTHFVEGLLYHGVMPVRLTKAFIWAYIHGVDVDIMMTFSLNYLPPDRPSYWEIRCREGSPVNNVGKWWRGLLGLFPRIGSHYLLKEQHGSCHQNNSSWSHSPRATIVKYIFDCFSTPMALMESVFSLYDSKKATSKRVLQLFETTKVVLSQRIDNL